MFFINHSELFILVTNITFLLFIHYFYKDLFKTPLKEEKLKIKEKNRLLLFIKYFAISIVKGVLPVPPQVKFPILITNGETLYVFNILSL
jgi:hypothetical protein